jgi:Spy/CpxP family protein refolding chaperone
MKSFVRLTLPVVLLLISLTTIVSAQAPQDPPQNVPPAETPDVSQQLRLSPDQVRRIREIQRDTKDERAAIGIRMRQANRALNEALDADALDENLVEQRLQDFAAAQTAQLRMRIQTELRIRRLLNPTQLARWRDLRLQAGDVMRAGDRNRPDRPGPDGRRQNPQNGLAPRPNPIRNPRP